jgi:hypothetical protein
MCRESQQINMNKMININTMVVIADKYGRTGKNFRTFFHEALFRIQS